MLVKYVRNAYGDKIGCVVALGKKAIGWSVVAKGDVFDKDLAKRIASGRAVKGTSHNLPQRQDTFFINKEGVTLKMPIRDVMLAEIEEMTNRSERYFK